MPQPVLSTYRLQLRGGTGGGPGTVFTFGDAERLVDYLHDLGVSHLYLSPVLTAIPGSEHGYDVTDPTTVSAALGGPEGLAALSRAARARGMGLIVDIVPNHLAVDQAHHNPWWWDVLTHGRASAYAGFFDIDWSADPEGRILLPVLGSDDDRTTLLVDGGALRCNTMSFPLAPGTADDGAPGPVVHDRQHYRLTGWRDGVCGYRRFFAVSSLAGLRQEDPAVFDRTHTEVARWLAEGLVDGVRVDHPDGLTDPVGYLSRLRAVLGPRAWIVIEKILQPGEPLDPALPVQGATGYDVLREVGGVFLDPSGATVLGDLADSVGPRRADGPELLRELKIRTVTGALGGELSRLCRSLEQSAGASHSRLAEAVAALLAEIGVYRCDYPVLAPVLAEAIARTVSRQPDLAAPLEIVSAALAADGEPAARLQQVCGAMTAKAVEDCHFYRDPRLVSLNEVGGDPDRFGVSAAEFHRSAQVRCRMWPHTMTTLSTHDTKRGEDVRARIGVLSQVPARWAERVSRWETLHPSPDPLTGLFLWQNIFGVWPADGAVTDQFRARLHAYTEKAVREAALRTTWTDPAQEFEEDVARWIDGLLDGPVAAELTTLVARLQPHALNDSLGQKLLALTVPGVPDVYQGTELWEDTLVDPDNRRPVDYAGRRLALSRLDHPKMRVVAAALRARRDRPATFLTGGYQPVLATGAAAQHLLAFQRGDDVLVAVSRWTVALQDSGWGDTALALPAGHWSDRITGTRYAGLVGAAELFAELPVTLLERTGD
jgi:(1->4)-alpha-D-glucan 1-alpha-D-glucosylmutase